MTFNMVMKMFKIASVECVDADEKYEDIIPMPMPTKTMIYNDNYDKTMTTTLTKRMILVNMTTHRCSDTRLEVFVLFC